MNKLFYIACVACLTFLFAGCKKDNVPVVLSTIVNNNPVGEAYGGTPAIPSGAAGAFYAVNTTAIDTTHTATAGGIFAWFFNDSVTLPAGVVTCIGDTLLTQVPSSSSTYPWYEGLTNSLPSGLTWTVSGSNSVAGFNYTDYTPFPQVNYSFTSVSASSPFTLNYTVTNAYDVIVFTLSGSRGVVTQTATAGSSITFSVPQINSATAAGDTHLAFQAMAIKTTTVGIGGLTYYFVKQSAIKNYGITAN
jgi:hypothetical protein